MRLENGMTGLPQSEARQGLFLAIASDDCLLRGNRSRYHKDLLL